MRIALVIVITVLLCIAVTLALIEYDLLKIMKTKVDNSDRILFLLKKWDAEKEHRDNFLEYRLVSSGYAKVAVYGYSILGRRLVRELEKTNVEVRGYIDRNAKNIKAALPVFSNVKALPEADVIIVTVMSQFYEIRKGLEEECSCPVIGLEELL